MSDEGHVAGRLRRRSIGLFVTLMLPITSGCATARPANFEGDFSTSQLGRDEYEIRFHGNMGVDAKTLEALLMRRAAELTLAERYTYFIITGTNRQAGFNVSLTTDLLRTSRQTTRSIMIRCSPAPGEPGATNAAEWLDSHGSASAPHSL